MPFFCAGDNNFETTIEMIKITIRQFRKIIQQVVTLQVRIPVVSVPRVRKRVSFSDPASMTVEAAVVLPLFLFAGVLLMMPFRMLDVERQVQAHVEAVGEDISQMAYFSLENTQGKEVLTTAAAFGYAEAAVRTKLKDLPVERITLLGSSLLGDGETVDLVVNYEMRLPFSVFGLEQVRRTSRCYRRAWVGREKTAETGENFGGAGDIVYVGRYSSRYHQDQSCHFLSNILEPVGMSELENYRNPDGSRYKACSRCGDDAGEMVYIMRYGEHYHSSKECSALQAYVSAVPRSQVVHLGPCSYCSGGS